MLKGIFVFSILHIIKVCNVWMGLSLDLETAFFECMNNSIIIIAFG